MGTKPRQLRLRGESLPRAFRGETPELYPDNPAEALKRFRPPSMIADHKGLATVFGIAMLILAGYFLKYAHTAPSAPTATPRTGQAASRAAAQAAAEAAAQSVYVEMVPPEAPARDSQAGSTAKGPPQPR